MDTHHLLHPVPSIGEVAPDFDAITTKGNLNFSDYAKNKWIILFSHPTDFTPTSTNEMSGFASRKEDFETMNTRLIGLSTHDARGQSDWVDSLKENTGDLFDFPIIADVDMTIAKRYGMVQASKNDTSAVRAVFFIDLSRKIRLIMYYPLKVGRNMNEIFRVLEGLQRSDKHGVGLPLDWKPGQKNIEATRPTNGKMNAGNSNGNSTST